VLYRSQVTTFGIFKKLQKATLNFVLSVCPSVHMEQLRSQWMDFHKIWYLSIFWKSVMKIQVWLKSDKNNWCFMLWPMHIMISCSLLFKMRNVLDKSCAENQNTHFVINNFLPKLSCLWDNVEKYDTARKDMGINKYGTYTLHAG